MKGVCGKEEVSAMSTTMARIGDRLRERRSNYRIEHLDEENHRLRTELGSMRSLLDHERAERAEILDALKDQPRRVVKQKRGGLLRSIVIGGGAYVLGSRAGRERYEQIVDWTRRMRDRGMDAANDLRADIVSDERPIAPNRAKGEPDA
jgi:hypothetical protein